MSKKKSTKKTAKKTTKKTAKKNAKESVLKKKSVKKKDVKKKVTKAAALPNDVPGLMETVTHLVNAVNKVIDILNTNIFPKSNQVLTEIKTTDETETNNTQMDLFPTDDTANQSSEFTQEDVTQALQKVSTIHGMGKVKDVLKTFKAERISDIYAKPDEYEKFISHCENVVATKPE